VTKRTTIAHTFAGANGGEDEREGARPRILRASRSITSRLAPTYGGEIDLVDDEQVGA
jgi:hypothetical protein